jgi:DNA-binding NtrC family response regulator
MTPAKWGHVIVVEDEAPNRDAMRLALSKAGFRVEVFAGVDEAIDHLKRHDDVLVIVTDLKMPGKDGFDLLREARAIDPHAGILMVTAHGSIDLAVEAMKQGADDFLTKPVDIFELRKRVESIAAKRRLEHEVSDLRERLGELKGFQSLIGQSAEMQRLYRQLQLVAPTRSTVLIIGESGTGKELVASAIHETSPRRAERFLPINCGAIPAEILESELFGHERGSFTGALARKIGKFEQADKGTLLLDEVGELSSDMQVKLLRVLESQEFMRVGGTGTIKVDVRILAATNADLEKAVAENRFRSDLYYRLKVVTVKLPPLRARREDIPMLAERFLERFCKENDRAPLTLSPEVMRCLVSNPWHGNVREMRNVIENLVIFARGPQVELDDLPPEYRTPAGLAGADAAAESLEGETPAATAPAAARLNEPAAAGAGTNPGAMPGAAEPSPSMDMIERRAILQALADTGGNRTQAALQLGIGLRTLQRKLKEYKQKGLA